jgi:hypothetical protein
MLSPVIRIIKRGNTNAARAKGNSPRRVISEPMVEILAAENFSFRTDDD